ncbi:cell envelope integrity protein TolA [Sphingomonas sp.]|jgi:hypothetical protein|uniref:cell envelope integrity protein TolA n=1 Tax=Sphingomonas sp. TaxID=28214 RepID=UPI002DF67BC0|nr:cell envelope integrity protein TolA [Sphingomonas sp.]
MLRSLTFLTLGGLSLSACATSAPPPRRGLAPELARKVTADAAAQVRRCYRTPKVLGEGKRITTRLHVRYAPDGTIIGLPTVIAQSGVTPANHIFADEMAQAAIASVVRCSPLKLPPELYEFGWNDFELTFSPALRG